MSELNKAEKPVKRGKAKFIYLGSVAVIALAAGGVIYGKQAFEHAIIKQIEQRGAKAASVEVDYLGRLHLRDVTVPLKNGRQVQIETVDARPKILFINGFIDANNVVADLGPMKVNAPQILVQDANLDQAGLRNVFGGSKDKPIAERIEQFSAGLISIPEMTLEMDNGPLSQSLSYKNLKLDNFNKGIIKKITIASANGSAKAVGTHDTSIENTVTTSFGEMNIDDLNLAFMARLYSEQADPNNNPTQKLHGPVLVKNINIQAMRDGEVQADFGYDEVISHGMTARLLPIPLLDLANKLQSIQDVAKSSATERVALLQPLVDAADMIDSGDFQLKGVRLKMPSDDDAPDMSINEIGIKIADQKLDFRIKQLDAAKDHAEKIKLGSFEVNQFSWQPTLQAFGKLAALTTDAEIEKFPYYTLLPDFGTWRLSDLDVNVEIIEPEIEAENVNFKLKEYELKASNPVNGIPSSFRGAMNDLTFKLTESMSEDVYQQLLALGYETITLSSVTDFEWDQANQTMLIKDISLSGKDMGSFSMSGEIGGFKKDFFSGDKVLTQVALLGLTARELNVDMVDHGFIGRWIDLQAEDQGMSAEELRMLIAGTVENSLQLAIGEQPKLQPVIEAFTKFLSKPGRFDLKLKAKSEKGLGMFDFLTASQDPERFIEKIDISVNAE